MTTFQVVWRGFDRHQVDDLIGRIEGTLGRGPLIGRPVTARDLDPGENDHEVFDVVVRGYDRHEVEARLAEYRAELAARAAGTGGAGEVAGAGGGLSDLIRQRRFRTVAIGGYDPEDVDAFLDEIVARLEGR